MEWEIEYIYRKSFSFVPKKNMKSPSRPILELIISFSSIVDYRKKKGIQYSLHELIAGSILAMLAGADDFTSMSEFCKAKKEFLSHYFHFPRVPSHDQFRWIYANINPIEFNKCFTDWTKIFSKITDGEIIPIDGKVLRATQDSTCHKSAMCIVSAWASSNGMSLGQVKTEQKSNEYAAIPKLLQLLDLKGSVVSIDAIATRLPIAKMIIGKKADYILALKKNNKNLYLEAESFFKNFKGSKLISSSIEQENKGHGREEKRTCFVINDLKYIPDCKQWPEIKSLICIESERTAKGKHSTECRYYISSLHGDASMFLASIRKHWSIENNLHWRLDVTFSEDQCRSKYKNCPENLNVARKIVLAILDADKRRLGGKNKRLRAAWNDDNLIEMVRTFANIL